MKIRSGFVSNSSTSSFIIAVNLKDTDKKMSYPKILSEMFRAMAETNKTVIVQDVGCLISNAEWAIKDFQEKIEHLNQKKKLLTKAQKNEDALVLTVAILQNLTATVKESFNAVNCYDDAYEWSANAIKYVDLNIEELNKKIAKEKELLKKYKQFKKDWVIISFEEDNWGNFRHVINHLVSIKKVVILKQESN